MNGKFVELAPGYFVDPQYETALLQLGLDNLDAVFSFDAGQDLTKKNLAPHRKRLQIEIPSIPATFFLKRFENPPIWEQLRNWLSRRWKSSMRYELDSANKLAAAGIKTARVVAYAEQWGLLFEKRSFIMTEKIPAADALERKLPDCFGPAYTSENLKQRREFIRELAKFARKFHETGLRHRDFYLSHIFYSQDDGFYLIDLQRVFKPVIFAERYRVKDIAQLYYSAPRRHFSSTDRLRFYLSYSGKKQLESPDRIFIRKVIRKTKQIARHDKKHGRPVPFEN
jgi:heptose I phosphotransferase